MNSYARNLFETRYKDVNTSEQSWKDVFLRVAKTIARSESEKEQFLKAMVNGDMIPSSPQLWNYGSTCRRFPKNGSSCFTGRMGDTLEDFRQADADAEKVYVASGGMGVLANGVRPRGCKIRHCSEGAMGSMCAGGPIRRIEGTTGYITGSGRARGALMVQLSVWHPDAIEFILAKRPSVLGWLDDWTANAEAVMRNASGVWNLTDFIQRFATKWGADKDWPSVDKAIEFHGHKEIYDGILLGIITSTDDCIVPMVTDWSTMKRRPANRDWDLPLQNCNMSIRVTDAFMNLSKSDAPWAFSWFDTAEPVSGERSWTKTDALGNGLEEVSDGRLFVMSDDLSTVKVTSDTEARPYRYGVVITTWEGLRQNLQPNSNQWRDTEYARFYRRVILPCTERFTGKILAKQVWHLICESAWNHADPGIVFEDTYERFQPIDSNIYGPRLSNPCSEYVSSPDGSCDLASLNLRNCYRESIDDQLKAISDVASLTLKYITQALDYNEAPIPRIHEMTSNHYRTVGVGIMGLAEYLILNRCVYGSRQAEHLAAMAMSEIGLSCWETSFDLAKNGTKTPLAWNGSKMETIFKIRAENAKRFKLPVTHVDRWMTLANMAGNGEIAAHTTTTGVAPTGTISQIAGWTIEHETGLVTSITSGVEPVFAWATGRTDNSGSIEIFHDLWNDEHHHGKDWMVTADQVSMAGHIRMQAAVCAFTDMSVSKTVNIPNSATVDDVKNGYRMAWSLEIPGTAIYRDGSKPMQVLTALECPSGECAVKIPQ